MREIDSHKIGTLNEAIDIRVLDEPGPGGANHRYLLALNGSPRLIIEFQHGPLQETAPNGISIEALLAIVCDRLRSFQSGEFSCAENERALKHCQEAMSYLHQRTRERIARNVEGKLEK